MIPFKYSFLSAGSAKFKGAVNDAVDFTLDHQLLNRDTWKAFVEVYRHDSDTEDLGWRNEYWGKMMRGACLTYMYNGNEELYSVLEESVRDLLSVKPADGAYTTYSARTRFDAWDLWGRKYILTGLSHFYAICKSAELKKEILSAMKLHADNIIENIGEGKKNITECTRHWLGVNSCSILEPFVELYKLTDEKKYLDFAEYIIGTGGCSGDNLIELAYENKLMPYEYPETKAYETMSFFEGVLAYYEVTGKEYYFEAVRRFIDAVAETDITIIGCSGCTHELFDHSAAMQTEYSDGIMQETCVTVTWMRVNARLFMLTGEEKYLDRIETAGYNALYGAMNTHELEQKDMWSGESLPPLPFDSYSPLFANKRGRGIGGLKHFSFGGHYGCCACIASAGTALMPLTTAVRSEDRLVISSYQNGEISVLSPGGNKVDIKTETDYPAGFNSVISVSAKYDESFDISFRIPGFVGSVEIFENNTALNIQPDNYKNGYFTIHKNWNGECTIIIKGKFEIKKEQLNGKSALTFGTLVLARDSAKEVDGADLKAPVALPDLSEIKAEEPENDELCRFSFTDCEGHKVILTDYASCGKNWLGEKTEITVWMDN